MTKNGTCGAVHKAKVGFAALLAILLAGAHAVPSSAAEPPVSNAATLTGYWLSQDHDGVFKIDTAGKICAAIWLACVTMVRMYPVGMMANPSVTC